MYLNINLDQKVRVGFSEKSLQESKGSE